MYLLFLLQGGGLIQIQGNVLTVVAFDVAEYADVHKFRDLARLEGFYPRDGTANSQWNVSGHRLFLSFWGLAIDIYRRCFLTADWLNSTSRKYRPLRLEALCRHDVGSNHCAAVPEVQRERFANQGVLCGLCHAGYWCGGNMLRLHSWHLSAFRSQSYWLWLWAKRFLSLLSHPENVRWWAPEVTKKTWIFDNTFSNLRSAKKR